MVINYNLHSFTYVFLTNNLHYIYNRPLPPAASKYDIFILTYFLQQKQKGWKQGNRHVSSIKTLAFLK